QRRRLDRRYCAVETHWPGWHLDLAGRGVVDRLHDAALGERRIVHQLQGVEYRPGRHAGGAEQRHRLLLDVLPGPGRNDLVDLRRALAARNLGVVARVAAEILATDDFEQALPVLGVGTAAEDVNVVIRPARLARVKRVRRKPARGRPAGS